MAKVLAFLTAFSCLLLAACRGGNTGELTVAAAANTRFAMEALTRSFTRETGIACRTVFSSSGKLTAQIRGGAPFDILVSADMRYPRSLFSSGYTAAAPEIYAYGRLVLWSLDSGVIPSPDQLSSPRITHIALANPKTAPYGAAAVEVLKRHDLYEKVENKLVYGESISQTNQFTISGTAEIGFTSLSVVLSPGLRGRGSWRELDTALYSPIAQGAVVLKNSKDRARAGKFYDFLFSEKGKRILQEFGYTVSSND